MLTTTVSYKPANVLQVCVDESMKMNFNAPLFFFDHPDNKTDVFIGENIEFIYHFIVQLSLICRIPNRLFFSFLDIFSV